MADLLLTHGYFMFDDPKELQILKPYAPLGILYLCSHLRAKGFDVDVFDTTFSSRDALFHHLRTEKPSILGVYANLMTRKNVVDILRVAREAGWRTVVGGPEPGAYAQEYLESGADFVVFGEGELTMEELLRSMHSGNADGCEQAEDIAVESHESTNGQSAPSYFIAPVAEDEPHAKNDHRNGSCAKRHFGGSLPDLGFCPFGREASKLSTLCACTIQQLQLEHACQVLLQKRAHLSRLTLNAVCCLF